MTREEARKAVKVMLAYADGKEIETKNSGQWEITCNPKFNWVGNADNYRIKPMDGYRPFKWANECIVEMAKHQPSGWLKDKEDGHYTFITRLSDTNNEDCISLNSVGGWSFENVMKFYTFADGTPFGVKE